MCVFQTPDMPAPPPPPPPAPNLGARRVFEPVGDAADDEIAEQLGLSQLRVRPPSVNV